MANTLMHSVQKSLPPAKGKGSRKKVRVEPKIPEDLIPTVNALRLRLSRATADLLHRLNYSDHRVLIGTIREGSNALQYVVPETAEAVEELGIAVEEYIAELEGLKETFPPPTPGKTPRGSQSRAKKPEPWYTMVYG